MTRALALCIIMFQDAIHLGVTGRGTKHRAPTAQLISINKYLNSAMIRAKSQNLNLYKEILL